MILRRTLLATPLALAATPAGAAPAAEPWPLWERHDPGAPTTIDHAPWGRFLASYRRDAPDGIVRFAYRAVTPADRAALEADIARLAALPISRFNRGEQFAYWVNLYNALTVLTVLRRYPVKSIRDIAISPGWFSTGPWGAKLIEVDGTKLSLDDAGRRFINHPRGAAMEGGRLAASSLFVWYRGDFGSTAAELIQHLRGFARQDLYSALAHIRNISVDRYDWALNDAP